MEEGKNELNDLLDDLENETFDLSEIPERRERTIIPVENIDDENSKDVFYKTVSRLFNKLERVSEELLIRIEEGDTYESTLQGFAAATGNIVNAISKIDAREARREKMRHDKEMAEIKRQHRLEEIEKRNEGKAGGPGSTNIQNNHFYGSITDCMREVNKLENPKEKEMDVIDVE